MKKIHCLSGLPRTGSTLLSVLLSQHPDIFCSKTSLVRGTILKMVYCNEYDFFYYDPPDASSRVWEMAKNSLQGAYSYCPKSTIIDKDRYWPSNIKQSELILGDQAKIICTVRSITEILSSFITLSRKTGAITPITKLCIREKDSNNIFFWSHLVWKYYVSPDWKHLKSGFDNYPDRFLFVDYEELISHPQKTVDKIFSFLGYPEYEIDFKNIVDCTPERDGVHGIKGLHTVYSSVKRHSPPAVKILGQECYDYWEKQNLEFWRNA